MAILVSTDPQPAASPFMDDRLGSQRASFGRELPVRLRLLVLAAALAAASAPWWGLRASAPPPPAATSVSGRGELARFQLQGTGSCASGACHNADPRPGYTGREYAIALQRDRIDPELRTRDRHAQAYDVLFNERSQKMARHLKLKGPAHQEMLCLRCHVHPGAVEQPSRVVDGVRQFRYEDGVSCEACHGPAERWLAAHFRPGWAELPAAERRAQGMADTRSVPGRARLCVDCHVGSGDMEVNHDLIAAGHPRLYFEMGSYHFFLHKHWDHGRDLAAGPDFEARIWAIGQLTSAQAALELLAERAADEKRPWPEFAEYDCFACHHDLKGDSWRQKQPLGNRKAGTAPWSAWYYAQLPQAMAALSAAPDKAVDTILADLQREMQTYRPNRQKVVAKARLAAELVGRELARDERATPGLLPVGPLFQQVLAQSGEKAEATWDGAAQSYLALSALSRAGRDLGQPTRGVGLAGLRELLRFPDRYNSPLEFDPAKVRSRLQELKSQGSR